MRRRALLLAAISLVPPNTGTEAATLEKPVSHVDTPDNDVTVPLAPRLEKRFQRHFGAAIHLTSPHPPMHARPTDQHRSGNEAMDMQRSTHVKDAAEPPENA